MEARGVAGLIAEYAFDVCFVELFRLSSHAELFESPLVLRQEYLQSRLPI